MARRNLPEQKISSMVVLILGGGPDAEREVSLKSAAAVAAALEASGRWEVAAKSIDRLTLAGLRALPGEVIFPALHGAYGEGGPLQNLMEEDGRPYVGCGPGAARLAMDKIATKLLASRAGIPSPEACLFSEADDRSPIGIPCVVKPVHEGSSVGLHIVKEPSAWERARSAVAARIRSRPGRVFMVERAIAGRELTVGLLDGAPLPIIHILPGTGAYDYAAKYERDDTRYDLDPPLPPAVKDAARGYASTLYREIGARHLARVDFILGEDGRPWLLEINTMPGFTPHSLLPMAARRAGIEMPELCSRLVEMALRDRAEGRR